MPNNLRSLSLADRRALARNPAIDKLVRAIYSFPFRIVNYVNSTTDLMERVNRQTITEGRTRTFLSPLLAANPADTGLVNAASNFRPIIINYVRNSGDAQVAIARADEVKVQIRELLLEFRGTIDDKSADVAGVTVRAAAGELCKCKSPKVWEPITETCV